MGCHCPCHRSQCETLLLKDQGPDQSETFSQMAKPEKSMSKQPKIKCPLPLDETALKEKGQEGKDGRMGSVISTLNQVCLKLVEINLELNHDTDGIHTKFNVLQAQVDGDTETINRLSSENKILKGLVQKQFHQINDLNDKVAMLSARSMEKNITISGVAGDIGVKEKCKATAINFLKDIMEIDVDVKEILVAHQIGKFDRSQQRPRILII